MITILLSLILPSVILLASMLLNVILLSVILLFAMLLRVTLLCVILLDVTLLIQCTGNGPAYKKRVIKLTLKYLYRIGSRPRGQCYKTFYGCDLQIF